MRRLGPSDLEFLVAELLRRMGFREVRVVGGPGDRGVDIEAIYESPLGSFERVGVQVKAYSSRKVGVREVKEFLLTLESLGLSRGIFVTTSDFTKEAYEFIESAGLKSRVELINGIRLTELLRRCGIDVESIVRTYSSYGEERRTPSKLTSVGRGTQARFHEITIDAPVINAVDPYTVIDGVSRKVCGRFDVEASDIEAEEVTFYVAPAYIIPWEVTYRGEDARGRVRLLKDRDVALVLPSGRVYLRAGSSDSLSTYVKEVLRKRYGVLEATEVKREGSIRSRDAVVLVKKGVASKYRVSTRDVRVKLPKKCFVVTRAELKLRVFRGEAIVEYDVWKGKVLELEAKELTDDEICASVNDKVIKELEEELEYCGVSKRRGRRVAIEGLTKSFRITAQANVFSGAIVKFDRELREEVAIELAKEVLPNSEVIRYERSGSSFKVLLGKNHEACLAEVNLKDGKIKSKCGLLGSKGATEVAIKYIVGKYRIREPYHVEVVSTDLSTWKVDMESEDGIAEVYVDLRKGKVRRHKISISELMARKIVKRKYVDMEITEVKDLGKEYLLKLKNHKHIVEARVSKSEAKITNEERYIRPDVAQEIAVNVVLSKFNDETNIEKASIVDREWVVELSSEEWEYEVHLSKIEGKVVEVIRCLTKEGALNTVRRYLETKYGLSTYEVEYLRIHREKKQAVARIVAKGNIIYYLRINASNAEVIEEDVLELKGFTSKLKRKFLDLKYR